MRKETTLRRICVYSGSSVGRRQEYQQTARDLGKEFVARNMAWFMVEVVWD